MTAGESSKRAAGERRRPRIAKEALGGSVLAVSWIAAAGIIEAIGRVFTNDLGDMLAVGIYVVLSALTVGAHRRRPLVFLTASVAWVRRLTKRLVGLGLEFGLDLRGEPPAPARLPGVLGLAVVAPFLLTVVLAPLAADLPHGIRDWGVATSYALYTLLLAVLWVLLLGGTVVAVLLPVAVLRVVGAGRPGGDGERRAVTWTAAYAILVLFFGAVVPAVWSASVAFAATVMLVGSSIFYASPGIGVLWRSAATKGRVYSTDWRHLVAAKSVAGFLLFAALLILGRGRTLRELPGPDTMPVTGCLASVFGSTVAAAFVFWAVLWIRLWRRGRSVDPAVAVPTSVFVGGIGLPAERTELTLRLERHGLAARFDPERPAAGDVLFGPEQLAMLAIGDVGVDAGLARQARRRDDVQRRRVLVRGMQKLFKAAARRTFAAGTGYWIGPQHWFLPGMWRDFREPFAAASDAPWITDIIGPPFAIAFGKAPRRHFHEVMRALALDMIFVEDGVSFERFRGVLRTIFELFDVHGGKRRAEEKYFRLLPGVHVIIHECEFEKPWSDEVYPEPDYREFARARILHVFRDRGGYEAPIGAPGGRRERPVVGHGI